MIGVDVGDHREHRREVQERRVRLVGFGDQELALAEARVGVGGQQPAADDERRIEAAFGEHRRDEARRRGLAVRAGDRDALLQAHQLGQHQRARHDRNAALARRGDFRIVGGHRRRHDDRVGAGDVAPRRGRSRSSTPSLARRARRRALGEVGARHAHSPASTSTSAMPLIPAPPMPTKCTRLTLCFIARVPERDAHVGDARGGVALAVRMRRRPPSPAARARSSDRRRSAQALRRQRRPAASFSAAPASTRNCALALCSSAIAPGSGTTIAPRPTAASSETVSAPPRQITKSAHA